MIIFAEMASWLWILILAIALIPIMSASKLKCERRRRFPFFALLPLLILIGGGLLFFIGSQRVVHQHAAVAIHAEAAAHTQRAEVATISIANVHEATPSPTKADPSLEALWDKLTKSKINLDGEASEPAADPADEKVKDAVKDTFGLDEQGQLPPKWVVTPPKQVGQVYRIGVASDPWATEEECRWQLEHELLPQAVARRIEYLAPAKVSRRVSVADPLLLGIGPDYILREICRDEFTGSVDSSVGQMKKVHVLMEFDENTDKHLVEAWLRHERTGRLASVSKVAAISLTGLAAIYGLLRFDTWSKGYYSRQLLVGGTLAIIALAVVLLRT